mmetsp:Transcript_93237/g.136202  ORF Transcript_93237/g.136202 Transcript_93237/m.136202 type:complete len:209 (-) Transcript_93237:82-708(-)
MRHFLHCVSLEFVNCLHQLYLLEEQLVACRLSLFFVQPARLDLLRLGNPPLLQLIVKNLKVGSIFWVHAPLDFALTLCLPLSPLPNLLIEIILAVPRQLCAALARQLARKHAAGVTLHHNRRSEACFGIMLAIEIIAWYNHIVVTSFDKVILACHLRAKLTHGLLGLLFDLARLCFPVEFGRGHVLCFAFRLGRNFRLARCMMVLDPC